MVALSKGRQEIVAPSWTTWCLPKRLALHALCALLAGVTREDQVDERRVTAAQKRELFAVIGAYAGADPVLFGGARDTQKRNWH